jgi:FkbM family methyltransferase
MGIISYAQNFEDVMLWRALGHIENGFYIDIGANDPVIDSVSLIFHEYGWHGIHVEPMTYYAELLRQQRLGDQIIQAAVGTEEEIIRFYEIPGEGISTGDPEIARQHRDRGYLVNETCVPAITLNSILELCEATEIHWLKIDVEGFEQPVIMSWAPSKVRPWIVVVESTLPMTQIPTHEEWESTLVGYGYNFVYFDGLNRYYLSEEHSELAKYFSSPPNVFDDFTLNGTAHAPFHRLVEMRYQSRIAEIEAQSEKQQQRAKLEIERLIQIHEELNNTATHREEELKEQLKSLIRSDETWSRNWTQRQNEHSGQIYLLKQELEDALRAHILREREVSEQLLLVRHQAEEDKSALHLYYQTRMEEMHREQVEREWLTSERIHKLNDSLIMLYRETSTREQAHAEQLSLIKQAALEKTNELITIIHEQSEVLINEKNVVSRLYLKQEELELQLGLKVKEYEEMSSSLCNAVNLEKVENKNLKENIAQQLVMEKVRLEEVSKCLLDTELAISNIILEMSTCSKSFIKRLLGRCKPDGLLSLKTKLHEMMTSIHAGQGSEDISETDEKSTKNSMENDMSISRKTANHSNPVAAKTASELFAHDDIDFIECAYISILGRVPDLEGRRYYLSRVRSGISKVEIAAQLVKSSEAGAYQPEIVGLKKEVRSFSIGRLPLIGWIYRAVNGLEGNGFSHRKLRAIENKLNLLKMQSMDDFDQLERSVSSLAGIVSRQAVPATTNGKYSASPVTAGDQPENKYMGFHRKIPHEADIFQFLKNEISQNSSSNSG